MKKQWKLALCLALAMCLLTGCAALPMLGQALSRSFTSMVDENTQTLPNAPKGDTVTISREEYEQYQQFDVLLDLMEQADLYFYEEVDHQAMLEGAAMGVLAGLGDPYTFYYTPEDYAAMWEDDEGEYAGVGMQITANYLTGLCTISRVFDGSPAQAAGVHKGDILYMVEDMYVSATNLEDAVDIMRGTPGTDVVVTFLRGTEERVVTMTRAQITVNRIEATMLTDEVGYIFLYEFAGDCATRFEEELNKLINQGAKGIMIDLRDNPGGWVDDAETIGDLFLEKGTLCYLEYKNGSREYYRTKDGSVDVPLVILVNENSASSSEILTGALKDRAGATVVGVQSYGKGIVQVVLPVGEDGAGMQMTVAQYYTPNGNAVHKIGITPDVEVPLPAGDNGMYEFADLADPQLARALEVMQEKIKNAE
ncbi:MAG: S41 family peptidase [Clostridiales bacterium]|nr:S41 family peptidase [Clostridiales bacterium]